jgi:hypothetical protein
MVVTGPARGQGRASDVDAAIVTPGIEVTVKNGMITMLTKRMKISGQDLIPSIASHAKRKAISLKIALTFNFL